MSGDDNALPLLSRGTRGGRLMRDRLSRGARRVPVARPSTVRVACATSELEDLKCRRPEHRYIFMELTDDERRLLLAGLYVLSIARVAENDDEREAVEALVLKLGGDPQATYFRSA